MNKLVITALSFFLINSISFAATYISGTKAQGLYSLLRVTPQAIDGASVKNISLIWYCQEKMVMNDNNEFIVYEYLCVLPDKMKDGRVYMDGFVAKSLFTGMAGQACKTSIKTYAEGNVTIKLLNGIECRALDTAKGTEYKCAIAP